MAELPVVVCPTHIEASFVRRTCSGRARIVVSGIGPQLMRAALASVPKETPAVILAGVAGGLQPLHDGGGAPRIRAVVSTAGETWIPKWTGPWPGHDEVVVVGVDVPAWTAEEKGALAAQTGADIVDCESHALAAWAQQSNIPWGVLRGVSDGPIDELPREIVDWVDPAGRMRPLAVARALIRKPSLIAEARRLRAATVTAMRQVAAQLDRVLDMIRASGAEDLNHAAPRVGVHPIDPSVKRVVVFGGTFDPPHRAHLELSAKAMRALNADAMLIVPAARSPHKETGPTVSDADRVAMLEMAFRGKPGVSICTLELERTSGDDADPSFTVDTLEALRRELGPQVQLRLLIGADQAVAFHRWREVDRILAIAPPAVLLRPPLDSVEELDRRLRQHWTPKQMAFWRSWIVPAPVSKISATEVRSSSERTGSDVPGAVARYIGARGLYHGKTKSQG